MFFTFVILLQLSCYERTKLYKSQLTLFTTHVESIKSKISVLFFFLQDYTEIETAERVYNDFVLVFKGKEM